MIAFEAGSESHVPPFGIELADLCTSITKVMESITAPGQPASLDAILGELPEDYQASLEAHLRNASYLGAHPNPEAFMYFHFMRFGGHVTYEYGEYAEGDEGMRPPRGYVFIPPPVKADHETIEGHE